ncbi:MAG: Thymidine kinase [candidate division TM6 bacterium GW2011_GWF2_32_72]|nr:MAG: Thymidine kinase [candidate division TM6 bacterium GW2011_GWF2_32_72]
MFLKKNKPKGSLEVICGSMFSGKSEELIRRLKRSQIAKQNTLAFKHNLDDRKTIEYVISHSGNKIKAFAVDTVKLILDLTPPEIEVIGIDEVQFFSMDIIPVVLKLVSMGKKVIIAGLDLDFRGIPFGPIPALLAIADKITKLNAICVRCGAEAQHTQRLIDGIPAKFHDPIVLVGAEECYEARCRNCYSIDIHDFIEKYEQKQNSI